MGLRFFRVGGRGGSWKLPVALLGVHTPTEKSATNLRNASIHRSSSSWINPANFGELRHCEVRRIPLKRTSEKAQKAKFAEFPSLV